MKLQPTVPSHLNSACITHGYRWRDFDIWFVSSFLPPSPPLKLKLKSLPTSRCPPKSFSVSSRLPNYLTESFYSMRKIVAPPARLQAASSEQNFKQVSSVLQDLANPGAWGHFSWCFPIPPAPQSPIPLSLPNRDIELDEKHRGPHSWRTRNFVVIS